MGEDGRIWKEGMELQEVGRRRREDRATHGIGNLRTVNYYFFQASVGARHISRNLLLWPNITTLVSRDN